MLGLGLGLSLRQRLRASGILSRLSSGRVDFVGIGDSNQVLSGHGWDHGFQYALDSLGYSMWATGLMVENENNGNGSGYGYLYAKNFGLTGALTGAPAELEQYMDRGSGGLSRIEYAYVASGDSNNGGFNVSGSCPLDTSAALEFDVHYGTFTSGSGQFRPHARLDVDPFTSLALSDIVSTNTGAYGMSKATIALTADAGRSGSQISGRPWQVGGTPITGPYFSSYFRWRNPGATTGYSYGTLDYRGGESLRTMANDLIQASDETLIHYFGILREDQNQTNKSIVICVNGGLNDRGETLTSLGPGAVTDGDSAEAYVDNFTAIKNRIDAIWTGQGWNLNELIYLVFPSHPVSDPEDAELESYRAAIKTYAAGEERVQVVDLADLTDETEMLAEGWYASSGADRDHLTQAGYESLAERVLNNVV